MTTASNPLISVKFSTGHLRPEKRLDAYREMLGRSVGCFDVEAIDEPFDFTATSYALPRLGFAHIASSALRVERRHAMPMDGDRDLVLAVVHEGSASRVQNGREVTVEGGGAFLSPSLDALVMQRSAARLTNYSFHSSDIAPMVSNLGCAMSTALPVNCQPIRLLTGYTNLVFGDDAGVSPELSRLAVSHILDLIALAIGATRDAAEVAKGRGLRAALHADLYARAGRFIALRIEDSDLSAGEIARQLGVSLRLLQKVFAERGDTVMSRVWYERVNRAARLLSAPESVDRSITDIAFTCGFNDSSHFGRVFAARNGMSPSQWRKKGVDISATSLSRERAPSSGLDVGGQHRPRERSFGQTD